MEDDRNIQELAIRIRMRLSRVSSPDSEYSIFRVHHRFHEGLQYAYVPRMASIGPIHRGNGFYVPRMVSIGPIHRGKETLKPMEDLKLCYLDSFLKRNSNLMIEDYLKAVRGLEEKARRCYGGTIPLSSEEFMEMMLLDGCFIIELFLQFKKEDTARSADDPIFSTVDFLKCVRIDLALLENQLPFFVLQCLFNISTVFNGGPSLIELALLFFNSIVPGHKQVNAADGPHIKHLLDLLRHSYAPISLIQTEPQYHCDALTRSATKLRKKAGVKFKKGNFGKAERTILDLKFHSSAVMEIPPLKIQEGTETLLRNFVAFEQCCGGPNTYITDYVSFMAALINSPADEDLLSEAGIIEKHLPNVFGRGSVHNLFNDISKSLVLHSSHYSNLFEKVRRHCASPWRVGMAIFLHDYLVDPAFLIFLLLPAIAIIVVFMMVFLL